VEYIYIYIYIYCINCYVVLVRYTSDAGEGSDEESTSNTQETLKPMKVDIDLGLSAYSNARK